MSAFKSVYCQEIPTYEEQNQRFHHVIMRELTPDPRYEKDVSKVANPATTLPTYERQYHAQTNEFEQQPAPVITTVVRDTVTCTGNHFDAPLLVEQPVAHFAIAIRGIRYSQLFGRTGDFMVRITAFPTFDPRNRTLVDTLANMEIGTMENDRFLPISTETFGRNECQILTEVAFIIGDIAARVPGDDRVCDQKGDLLCFVELLGLGIANIQRENFKRLNGKSDHIGT